MAMSDPVVTMVDTVGSSVRLELGAFPYVGGYVSGSGGIEWTAAQWALFGKSRHVRIYQSVFENAVPFDAFDVYDMESGAVTPAQAARGVAGRVHAGIDWTTGYGSDGMLAAFASEVQKFGHAVWNGHVNCWLADWNLNEAEAAKLIGTKIHGMTCVAVQWASPTSNPNTLLPGTKLTLREANVDLSVVDGTWVPSGGWGGPVVSPVPPPPPPVKKVLTRVVGEFADGTSQVLWQ
jgi:hypothetical protein